MRFSLEHREAIRQKRLREPQSVHARARAKAVVGALCRVGAADLLMADRLPVNRIMMTLRALADSTPPDSELGRALWEVLAFTPDSPSPPLHTFMTLIRRNRPWVLELIDSMRTAP